MNNQNRTVSLSVSGNQLAIDFGRMDSLFASPNEENNVIAEISRIDKDIEESE